MCAAGWGGSNCPFADKSSWWLPSWLLADNNQRLAAIYPALLKLLLWILCIPRCWHFCLDSPPLLGIFLCLFSWTGSTSQCWSHPAPFPQELSNTSKFLVLPHWLCEFFSEEISPKGTRIAKENWELTLTIQSYSHASWYSKQKLLQTKIIANKNYSKQKIANKGPITGQTLPFPTGEIFFFSQGNILLKPSLLSILFSLGYGWIFWIPETRTCSCQCPEYTTQTLCIHTKYWSILRTVILLLLGLQIMGHYCKHTHIFP